MHLPTRMTGLILLCVLLPALPAIAQTAPATAAKSQSNSGWAQLHPLERQALAPLAPHWGDISEGQRSKWRTIAKNFDQLSPADQQLMQARMTQWAALSPVQRNQARLNFNTVQSVAKDQRKTRWDEYQALSEDEKRKLSAGALGPAKTTAPSPKPTAADRLVQPTVRTVPAAALPPRAPIDKHTLLPVPASSVPTNTIPQDTPASEPPPAKEAPAS